MKNRRLFRSPLAVCALAALAAAAAIRPAPAAAGHDVQLCLKNEGIYIARLEVSYQTNGNPEYKETGDVLQGNRACVMVPGTATEVAMKGNVTAGASCRKTYDRARAHVLYMGGTSLHPVCDFH